MPPPMLVDPSTLDFENLLAGPEEIRRINPHRFEFQLLDGVVLCDKQAGLLAGFHDIRTDAWWTRGHIPGRPLFPGVLMIEVAAQMCSYLHHKFLDDPTFLGFVGVEGVKFRGVVSPPARLVIIGKALEVRKRRTICQCQGFVDGTMVFEGTITGMPV